MACDLTEVKMSTDAEVKILSIVDTGSARTALFLEFLQRMFLLWTVHEKCAKEF